MQARMDLVMIQFFAWKNTEDVYKRQVFMRAMQEEGQITPILEMFLNFGFMDVQMVGEDNANALYLSLIHIFAECTVQALLFISVNTPTFGLGICFRKD